jgi:receptor-interacting serine/threonine-protein kinase 5
MHSVIAGIDTEREKLSGREVKECAEKIQEMVLSKLNSHVAGKLVSSVNILRDSYTGEFSCNKDIKET